MGLRIPHGESPVEIRQGFQRMESLVGVLSDGASGELLVGVAVNLNPVWQSVATAIDHGSVGGLSDDDHTQYHNDARGDARYYTETELDAGQLDNRYFTESEHITTSAGAADSGKPIVLDAAGHVDATMINDGDIDHGSIGGLGDDDHTQYLLADGTRALTGNWSLGSNDLTSVGLYGGVNVPTANTFFNGTFQETFDALVTATGGVITMSLEQSGGGDLVMQFSDGYTTLDCTSPVQTIVLTAGASDSSPQANYIYVLQSSKVLVKSTSAWPDAEHIKVAYFLVPTATFVENNGCYVNQNWNDHLAGTDLQGNMSHMTQKLRKLGATWFSGVNPNGGTTSYFTIGSNTTDWLSTSGVIDQMHEHTFPAVETSGSDIVLVVNQFGTAYDDIVDLYLITDDNTGTEITNNRYFNLVFWGVMNKTGEFSALMVNLPGGFYTKQSDALIDSDGHDVYDFPREFSIDSGTAFLICRATFKMGSTWTHASTVDLRGLTPATASGSSVNDHGGLGGLLDVADHPDYLLLDGTRALTGNMAVDSAITIDGRDLSIDGTKLDTVETNADVTDTTNVAAAGAAMSGEAFHDGFSDYVGNEHVDHSGVNITAGSGLAGGGDLTTTRTVDLDINSLAAATIVAGDFVPFWDLTATATNKKTTFANFEAALTHDNLVAGTIVSHDTTATGANLTSLTNDSMVDTLHRHSELSASDGSPNRTLMVSASGLVGVGTIVPKNKLHVVGELYIDHNEVGSPTGPLMRFGASNNESFFLNNGYYSGGSKYSRTGGASYISFKHTTASDSSDIVFNFAPSGSANAGISYSERFRVKQKGEAVITTATDVATQAFTIDQNDVDQAFIDYQGTSAASAANSVSSWTSGATIQGFVRVEINGTVRWMPFYDAPTS